MAPKLRPGKSEPAFPQAATAFLRTKVDSFRKEMGDALIEREEEIDLVLTALFARENCLLVGPPGVAKSMLVEGIASWMGSAKPFYRLLTKFSVPEELFGMLDVQAMTQGVYRRITKGKLPEVDFAILDEVFKASPAILNTVLRIMNERIYENDDGTVVKVPLLSLMGASNEYPNSSDGGQELSAMFDRFLIRKTVKPVNTDEGLNKLLWVRNHKPQLSTSVSRQEIEAIQTEADRANWVPDSQEAFVRIIREIRKEGIVPGDRRMFKAVAVCQAYAWLNGSDTVLPEHLEVLQHVLWEDPSEQPAKVRRIVAKVANPVNMILQDKRIMVQEILTNKKAPAEAIEKLKAVQKDLYSLKETDSKKRLSDYIGKKVKELLMELANVE